MLRLLYFEKANGFENENVLLTKMKTQLYTSCRIMNFSYNKKDNSTRQLAVFVCWGELCNVGAVTGLFMGEATLEVAYILCLKYKLKVLCCQSHFFEPTKF